MGSKDLLIFYVPDADPDKNTCMLETPSDTTFIVLVRNQEQALKVCKKYAEEGIESIILCPHFTPKDFAEIEKAVGTEVELYQIKVEKISKL